MPTCPLLMFSAVGWGSINCEEEKSNLVRIFCCFSMKAWQKLPLRIDTTRTIFQNLNKTTKESYNRVKQPVRNVSMPVKNYIKTELCWCGSSLYQSKAINTGNKSHGEDWCVCVCVFWRGGGEGWVVGGWVNLRPLVCDEDGIDLVKIRWRSGYVVSVWSAVILIHCLSWHRSYMAARSRSITIETSTTSREAPFKKAMQPAGK